MNMDRMNEIIEKYGAEYMLRQMAEECCELAQAAMKLIRAWNKETPMRATEAMENMMEEMADVSLMVAGVFNNMLTEEQKEFVYDMNERKEQRMYARMLDGKMEEDVW